jgi:dihydroorotase
LDRLEGFVSTFGRSFYGVPAGEHVEGKGRVVLLRKVQGKRVEEKWDLGGESVVPFWAGKELGWEIVEK